jgi:predicted amidohydrolase YtcJ
VLIARAEIDGRGPLDVRITRGRVAEIGPALARRRGEESVDAGGGALLPGLHDHHLHLLALAAAERSLRCGPPEVRTRAELARALAPHARGEGWLRGVGYHESVAGELDRRALDAWAPARPLRIQHRSGALWILNSAAVERLGLAGVAHPGIERDARGRPTGRLFRADAWLRERLGAAEPPDLAGVGRRLARLGVTGVTDATASSGPAELALLVSACDGGALPQRVLALGGPDLPALRHPRVTTGALKLHLADTALPDPDRLADDVAAAHAAGRSVAIHCVTRAEGVLAVAALAAAGAHPGDRIEHGAVAPPELVEALAKLGVTVVTQPGFVHARGDAYASDVEAADLPWLWRARGLRAAGVPLAAGTDAPFGDPDPWLALRAAVERRTAGGAPLGPDEALSPEQALRLFLAPLEAPGGGRRRVAPGAPADLCLLDRPWREARRALARDLVAATWCDGARVFARAG